MTNKEAKYIAERNKDNLDPDVTLDALKELRLVQLYLIRRYGTEYSLR